MREHCLRTPAGAPLRSPLALSNLPYDCPPFPLPAAMYRKVYIVSPRFGALLSAIHYGMLVVCVAAAVGSCYTIVQSWQTFKVSFVACCSSHMCAV